METATRADCWPRSTAASDVARRSSCAEVLGGHHWKAFRRERGSAGRIFGTEMPEVEKFEIFEFSST